MERYIETAEGIGYSEDAMAFKWRAKGEKDVLICIGCGADKFTVRSEPVKRKRHTRHPTAEGLLLYVLSVGKRSE